MEGQKGRRRRLLLVEGAEPAAWAAAGGGRGWRAGRVSQGTRGPRSTAAPLTRSAEAAMVRSYVSLIAPEEKMSVTLSTPLVSVPVLSKMTALTWPAVT